MNEQEIVSKMISFIEKIEREFQQQKFKSVQQAKNNAINEILKKIEEETHENKND